MIQALLSRLLPIRGSVCPDHAIYSADEWQIIRMGDDLTRTFERIYLQTVEVYSAHIARTTGKVPAQFDGMQDLITAGHPRGNKVIDAIAAATYADGKLRIGNIEPDDDPGTL